MLKGHLVSIVYFITALILGALAWFEQSEGLDIAFNGVYVVVPKSGLWLILAGLFLFFTIIALCFELFRKPMNKYLFVTHFFLTIVGLVIIYLSTKQQEIPQVATTDYSVIDDIQNQPEEAIEQIAYAIYMLVAAQIIFVLNILVSIIRSRRQSPQDSN